MLPTWRRCGSRPPRPATLPLCTCASSTVSVGGERERGLAHEVSREGDEEEASRSTPSRCSQGRSPCLNMRPYNLRSLIVLAFWDAWLFQRWHQYTGWITAAEKGSSENVIFPFLAICDGSIAMHGGIKDQSIGRKGIGMFRRKEIGWLWLVCKDDEWTAGGIEPEWQDIHC